MCADGNDLGASFRKIDEFIAHVDRAQTLDAVFDVIRPYVEDLGFERFAYWLLWPPEGPRKPLYVNSYPADWIDYYTDRHLAGEDVVMRYSSKVIRPYEWNEAKEKFKLTPKQILIFGEGAEAGLRAGATVPITGPGKARAVFSVSNNESDEKFIKLFHETRHALHLFATYAHEKIISIGLHTKKKEDAPLTPREIEVLTWTSRGKTKWEISQILNVGEETIKTHLENCCLKLEAQNKTHAAAIALINGLIIP